MSHVDENTPLGVVPRYIRDEQRLMELVGAVMRYTEAGLSAKPEWLTELAEVCQRINQRKNIKD